MLVRAFLFGAVRMVAVLATAIGVSFDLTGNSAFGLTPDSLRLVAYIAFAVFFLLTVSREVLLLLEPHPKVEYKTVSPAVAEILPNDIGSTGIRQGYFTRLVFRNDARNPSGKGSSAQDLVASISILDEYGNARDKWEGRWANTGPPASHGEKWIADRIDLPPNNQEAILDIGLRLGGESYFQGFDNGFHIRATPRKHIEPGTYQLLVILGASNLKAKTWRFRLTIPEEPQSSGCHISVERI